MKHPHLGPIYIFKKPISSKKIITILPTETYKSHAANANKRFIEKDWID